MGTEKFLRVGIDGTGAQHGAHVVKRSLEDISNGASRTDSVVSTLKATLFGIGGAAVGIYGIATAFQKIRETVGGMLDYMGRIETSTLSIAASFLTGGNFIDTVTGKVLKGQQALNSAMGMSKDVIEQLKAANFDTIATLDQLINAYQVGLPVAMAHGFDKQKVLDFTLAMVQAAGAMGRPFETLAQEMYSLLNGTINARQSHIATVLGIRTEDMTKYKTDSAELFGFLMSKLEGFRTAGEASKTTWLGLWSNFKDVAQQALAGVFEPLFNEIKSGIKSIIDSVGTLDSVNHRWQWSDEALSALKTMRELMNDVISVAQSVIDFFREYGGAIKTVVEGYLLYKAATIANALAQRAFNSELMMSIRYLAQYAGLKNAGEASPYGRVSVNSGMHGDGSTVITGDVAGMNKLKRAARTQGEYFDAQAILAETQAQEALTAAKVETLAIDRQLLAQDAQIQAQKVQQLALDNALAESAATSAQRRVAANEAQIISLTELHAVQLQRHSDELLILNTAPAGSTLQVATEQRLLILESQLAATEAALGTAQSQRAAEQGSLLASETALIAATESYNVALGEQAVLGERLSGITHQLTAADIEHTAALAAEEAAGIASIQAKYRAIEANEALTLSSRVAAAATNVLRGALALVGGPMGAVVLGFGAILYSIDKYINAVKDANRTRLELQNGSDYAQALDRISEKEKQIASMRSEEVKQAEKAEESARKMEGYLKRRLELELQLQYVTNNPVYRARASVFGDSQEVKNLKSELWTVNNNIEYAPKTAAREAELDAQLQYKQNEERQRDLHRELEKAAREHVQIEYDINKQWNENRLRMTETQNQMLRDSNQEWYDTGIVDLKTFLDNKKKLALSDADAAIERAKHNKSDVEQARSQLETQMGATDDEKERIKLKTEIDKLGKDYAKAEGDIQVAKQNRYNVQNTLQIEEKRAYEELKQTYMEYAATALEAEGKLLEAAEKRIQKEHESNSYKQLLANVAAGVPGAAEAKANSDTADDKTRLDTARKLLDIYDQQDAKMNQMNRTLMEAKGYTKEQVELAMQEKGQQDNITKLRNQWVTSINPLERANLQAQIDMQTEINELLNEGLEVRKQIADITQQTNYATKALAVAEALGIQGIQGQVESLEEMKNKMYYLMGLEELRNLKKKAQEADDQAYLSLIDQEIQAWSTAYSGLYQDSERWADSVSKLLGVQKSITSELEKQKTAASEVVTLTTAKTLGAAASAPMAFGSGSQMFSATGISASDWQAQQQAARDAAQKAADAWEAAQEAATVMANDLTVRTLELQGRSEEASLQKLIIKQQSELNKARKDGISTTQLLIVQQQELSKAYDNMVAESMQKAINLSKGLLETAKGMLTGGSSILSPEASYKQVVAEYASAYAATQTGSDSERASAMEEFKSVAQRFVEVSRSYNASGVDYVKDFTRVQTDLKATSAQSLKLVNLQQSQLDVARASYNALMQLRTALGMGGSTGFAAAFEDYRREYATGVVSLSEMIANSLKPTITVNVAGTSSGGSKSTATLGGGSASAWSKIRDGQIGYVGMPSDHPNQSLWYNAATGKSEWFTKGFTPHKLGGIASGMSLVGEEGPELVDFQRPARVYTARQTADALSNGGNTEAQLDELRKTNAQLEKLIRIQAASMQQLVEQMEEMQKTLAKMNNTQRRAA